tara:strand:+ start:124 stop:480 length:357 start_codon:yes stop_codon:yes gene_type:complete
MEKLLCEVTISMSSTIKEGRYKLVSKNYVIKRETAKTVIIDRAGNDHKHLTSELMEIKPTRKNDKMSQLGFKTICLHEDRFEAGSNLKAAIQTKMTELARFYENSIAAWEKGCLLEEV